MKWNINKSLPICPQICEFISLGIVNEKLKPGEKINSVRELALMILSDYERNQTFLNIALNHAFQVQKKDFSKQ